jgi:predicted DNA-binding transcriptional regulator AlpA
LGLGSAIFANHDALVAWQAERPMKAIRLMSRQVALPPTLAPRLINREAAAAYVNVCPSTFDEMVKAGKMPQPKLLTDRRKAWDVRGLDIYIDNLPTAGAVQVDDDTWSDIDAA